MAGYKNRLLLFMGDSLFFALTNNRLFRCTPCGVIGFSAYRSVGAQADSVGSAFFRVADYGFDSVSASHFERSGRSADGVSDLIAGDLSVLPPFQSNGSGTAGAGCDRRSGDADRAESRSGADGTAAVSFDHVSVLGSVDKTVLIEIGNGGPFFDRRDLFVGAIAGFAVDVITAGLVYLAPGDFDSGGIVCQTSERGLGESDFGRRGKGFDCGGF